MITISESELPVSVGLTHQEALENGAKLVTSDPDKLECGGIGRVSYCSGTQLAPGKAGDWQKAESYKTCHPSHKGTEAIQVHSPSAAPAEWVSFALRVDAAWNAFVASGYSPKLRGVNNFREYKVTAKVSEILRSSRGAVMINGAPYVVAESSSAGVSLKRPIPAAHQAGNMLSFIFHL